MNNKTEKRGKFSDAIIVNNHHYVVVKKAAGQLSLPGLDKSHSLMDDVRAYTKSALFPVHRLDRPVSGLILFAKTKTDAAVLSKAFQDKLNKKSYIAIVEKPLENDEGTLTHHMYHDSKQKKAIICEATDKKALECTLEYKLIVHLDRYSAYLIVPKTGRFHQIRAQLSAAGSPIKGDVKYGARRSNKDRSIHLHAYKLSFPHPVDKTEQSFFCRPPVDALWDFVRKHLKD